jgi:hypothetical protein
MDNQHRKIQGQRELTAAEIALINKIQAHAEATGALVAEVRAYVAKQFKDVSPEYREPVVGGYPFAEERMEAPEVVAHKEAERERLNTAEPFKWLHFGENELQRSFMALKRAVAQPSSF